MRAVAASGPSGWGCQTLSAIRFSSLRSAVRPALLAQALMCRGPSAWVIVRFRPGSAESYFQRKWTKTRPKFWESFSTRW
jgi:hypothetical protein